MAVRPRDWALIARLAGTRQRRNGLGPCHLGAGTTWHFVTVDSIQFNWFDIAYESSYRLYVCVAVSLNGPVSSGVHASVDSCITVTGLGISPFGAPL